MYFIGEILMYYFFSFRVTVLDKGKIVEFDAPNTLLQKKTSIFYGMAKDAGLVG